jgi:ribosomal protein S18 acetylase RimI-like enzyme
VTQGDLLQAETCRLEAWPATYTENVCGWILRAMTGGYSRTNSVWPGHFDAGAEPGIAIDAVEAFYRRRALPACFQVLRDAKPDGLDAMLAARGYVVEAPCLTMAKVIGPVASMRDVPITITEEPTPGWRALYEPTLSKEKARELPAILERVPTPRAFAVAEVGGAPAGIGLGAMVGSDVSIDCVLTATDYRRKGVAHELLAAIEMWSTRRGMHRMVLSVVAENRPAVSLYERLGFETIGGYHYRVLGTARQQMQVQEPEAGP